MRTTKIIYPRLASSWPEYTPEEEQEWQRARLAFFDRVAHAPRNRRPRLNARQRALRNYYLSEDQPRLQVVGGTETYEREWVISDEPYQPDNWTIIGDNSDGGG